VTRSSRLDHIVVVAHSLAAGSEWVEKALGVPPGPGRKHPHMGTHNLLLALGASVYLEVVAIDPDAAPIATPRWFGLDNLAPSPPRLAAWVACTDDIFSSAVPELGRVQTMHREGRSWKMTVTADGSVPLSGAAPLLIQRESKMHPAAVLPESDLRLRELRIRHPAPAAVSALLSRIGLAVPPRVTVTQGANCALVAEIETAHGLRVLGGR
jgi:Glyoxalase-like domain